MKFNIFRIAVLGIFLFHPEFTSAAAKSNPHAHQHGHAQVNVVVDGKLAIIEIVVPSESVYGFEYQPRNAEDSAKQNSGLALLKAKIGDIMAFDSQLGCKTISAKTTVKPEVEQEPAGSRHGQHSEVEAEFTFSCGKNPSGTTLRFHFIPYFPKIRDLKVQVISGNNQTGADIENDDSQVAL